MTPGSRINIIYVYGADHVGASLRARQMEALEFLTSVLNPKQPNPAAAAARKRYAPRRLVVGQVGNQVGNLVGNLRPIGNRPSWD